MDRPDNLSIKGSTHETGDGNMEHIILFLLGTIAIIAIVFGLYYKKIAEKHLRHREWSDQIKKCQKSYMFSDHT